MTRQTPLQSSFKRGTPVMGNRSLETRNSKRSQQSPMVRKESPSGSASGGNSGPMSVPTMGLNSSPALPANPVTAPLTVGALEVHNVKRAIHRYGTLPKGARIGAYLESLRHGASVDQPLEGATSSPSTNGHSKSNDVSAPPPPPAQAPSNLAVVLNSAAPPATSPKNTISSPRPVPKSIAQPHMIRSNSSSGVTMANSASASVTKLQRHRTTTEGNMMSFSSFRSGASGSPKRGIHPTLADLEFPPPPADLPPPPEEFENGTGAAAAAKDQMHTSRSGTTSQMETSVTVTLSSDVSNTAPSVEEASSRFGVSLRRRERSTDSCSSLGSPAEPHEALKEKLSAEVKGIPGNPPKLDPASMLVNELAESMNLKVVAGKTSSAASTPNHLPPKTPVVSDYATGGGFKSQLKRVEPKKVASTPPKAETSAIIDFKSRLRKVENNNDDSGIDEDATRMKSDMASNESLNNDTHGSARVKSSPTIAAKSPGSASDQDNNNLVRKGLTGLKRTSVAYGDPQQQQNNNNNNGFCNGASNGKVVKELKKTEIKIDIQAQDATEKPLTDGVDGEDKRKSTGSISSLKKLWEAKEVSPLLEQPQLSPKLAMKNGMGSNNNNNDEAGDDANMAKKPAVPLKPTNLTIYATPIQTSLTTGPSTSTSASAGGGVAAISGSVRATSRESILELVSLLECSFKMPVSSISASQWLQLSDKLNILQTSCVSFADRESLPPHSKFQFRELVGRVETQSRSLRSAGNKNSQDNEKLVVDVQQSLKQITNALHR